MNNGIFNTASFSTTEIKAKLDEAYGAVKATFNGVLTSALDESMVSFTLRLLYFRRTLSATKGT
jgi:hypothetical protein